MTRLTTTIVVCLWQSLVALIALWATAYTLFAEPHGNFVTFSLIVLSVLCLGSLLVWLSRMENTVVTR